MQVLKDYFGAMDGTHDWGTLKTRLEALLHADCVLATADGDKNRDEWTAISKGLFEKGARASNLEISSQGDDAVYYKVTVTFADGTVLQPQSKGTLKDGQIIRVEPVDPEVYAKLSRNA